jgi:hypothetical protein
LTVIRSVEHYFLLGLRRDISRYPISYNNISQGNASAILDIIKLLILAQVECDQSDIFLPSILGLSETTKAYIAGVVEGFKNDDRVRYVEYVGGDQSIRMDVSTAVGIEYDRESRQHFADKDRMIEDQNKLISTLQSRIDEQTATIDSLGRLHASRISELEEEKRQLSHQLLCLKDRCLDSGDSSGRIPDKDIAHLEDRVSKLTDENKVIPSLKSQIIALTTHVEELSRRPKQEFNETAHKEQELADFIASGGTLSGGIRDRVIATLQQQLIVREKEVNFHRDERNKGTEHHKKTEKLLVSAIHSIALRYHEEMVARYDQEGSPMHPNADKSSQGDSMYGS